MDKEEIKIYYSLLSKDLFERVFCSHSVGIGSFGIRNFKFVCGDVIVIGRVDFAMQTEDFEMVQGSGTDGAEYQFVSTGKEVDIDQGKWSLASGNKNLAGHLYISRELSQDRVVDIL